MLLDRSLMLAALPALALFVACYGGGKDNDCEDSDSCPPTTSGGSTGTGAGGQATGGKGGAGGAGRGGAGAGGSGGTTGTGGSSGGTGGSAGTGGSGGTSADSTPVSENGKLWVDGKQLKNEAGSAIQLKGISSMWLNWEDDGYAESLSALEWLRDNWNLEIIRVAMGIDAEDAYLEDSTTAKAQVDTIVSNAITLGLYVIIDWHDHEALQHQAEAEAFFDEMATKYGTYDNVLYEVFNEPLALDWTTELKPYHEALTAKIRAKDPDNLIILGTPNWSQDVDLAAASPVAGTNLLYTLHFYACTHGEYLRDKATSALAANLPLFVTEWGATAADGGLDGVVCPTEAQTWHTFMNANQLSWTAWKFDGCTDSSCLLVEGAPVNGPFDDLWLQGHGPFVRDRMLE